MKHNRRSIRLKEYDYAQAGAYFVTICTQNRECLFGEIVDGEMRLNAAGNMIVHWYEELENKFPDIQCDAFVCMPNHIHFIVINTGTDTETNNITDVRADVRADLRVRPDGHDDQQNTPQNVGADLRVRPDWNDDPEYSGGYGGHSGGNVEYRGGHAGPPLRCSPVSDSSVSNSPRPGSSLSHVVQWFKTMTTNAYIRGVKQSQWPPFPGKLWQRNYYEHVIRNEQSCNRIREYIINNPMQWYFDLENPDVTTPSNESKFATMIAEVTE